MSGIMSMVLGAKTAIAAAVDAYFNLVTLLLPGNGTNGAQNNTFLDSSSNNFTITRNGNTTQGTFSPFSQTGWSTYINANGNYFTSGTNSALGFGTGDFTIEFFVYIVGFTDNQFLVDFRPSGSGGATKPWIYLNTSGTLIYGTSGATQISGGTVTGNAWHHIAVSRASGSTKMFLNGAQVGSTYTDSNNYGTSERFVVGTFGDAPGNSNANGGTVIGYMSNLRILKGTGLYTGSYTVPTAALTAITNTSVLTFQSNRWVDNSTNAIAITPSGSPSVQAFSPFAPTAAYSAATNGGSGYFDGNGDYLTVASTNAILPSGTQDYSVEAWVYWGTQTTSYPQIVANPANDGFQLIYDVASGTLVIGRSNVGTVVTYSIAQSALANQWTHIVATRSGNTHRLFVNGVLRGNAVNTVSFAALSTQSIGSASTANYYVGYMAGLRTTLGSIPTTYQTSSTTNGTSIFTPPTAPPTTTSEGASSPAFLLNYTNAGITDATAKNDLETVGNAQISTTQSKFGGSSMYFDGTDDRLPFPASKNFIFGTGDFTIEGWVRRSDTNTRGVFQLCSTAGGLSGAANLGLALGSDTGAVWRIYANNTGYNSTATFSANTWYHFALVRNSGTTKLYIDGTSVISQADTTNYSGEFLCVGGYYDTSFLLNGYIDDFRITKGYARYTANFSAPTAAFPLS